MNQDDPSGELPENIGRARRFDAFLEGGRRYLRAAIAASIGAMIIGAIVIATNVAVLVQSSSRFRVLEQRADDHETRLQALEKKGTP